ncbi:MAG: LamG-like jellyroll fold domain-containing protein [Candidatus Micrarchaeia archaeon]
MEKTGKASYMQVWKRNGNHKAIFRARPLLKARAKAQSAMEYLMTYGWAILIIAVVLGALFQLGVFNGNNFAPKAPPGACQVFRPNGPDTTSFINLEGVCNGELPEYVASFNPSLYAKISATVQGLPIGAASRTVTAWFEDYNQLQGGNMFMYGTQACPYYWFSTDVGQYPGEAEINTCNSNQAFSTPINKDTWYFIAFEYNGIAQIGYLGAYGTLSSPLEEFFTANTASTPFYIGYGYDPPGYYNGSIANVQLYNTSLSANEIQALYQEGIGGAPVDLQNLVAWYPLNGNADDYSGNGNNGQATGVTYISNWYSGYTPP